MALSQAANLVEKAIGKAGDAVTEQDMSNPARDPSKYGDPSGEMMKALTWQGKGTVKIIEVPKPRILEPGDVIMKVTATTCCGSDLHLLRGAILELQKGDILGHEFAGVVDSIGSSVKNLKPGQRAVASFQFACGECYYCQRKLSSQCEKTNMSGLEDALYGGRTAGLYISSSQLDQTQTKCRVQAMQGYSHLTGGVAGGQAEYVRVPFGEVNLLPLPDSVPDEKGLYLSDVLCTSWHCVVDTGVKEGDVVAIWGAGSIGQMCCEFAFINGASRVILIDGGPGAWRLDFVKSHLPKVETVDFTKLPKGESITSLLKKLVHSGPDVALECVAGEYPKGWGHYLELLLGAETDTSELLNEMITSVKSFGRCGVTGVYAGFTNHFNIGSLMERGVRLIGNGQAPVHLYWEQLLKYIEEDKIHPLSMVTHRVLLDDLPAVYMAFEAKDDRMQKVFVQTKFSEKPCPGSPQDVKRFSL